MTVKQLAKNAALLSLMCGVFALGVDNAFAGPGDGSGMGMGKHAMQKEEGGMGIRRELAELNLSAEQKTKIDAILAPHWEEQQKRRDEMFTLRSELLEQGRQGDFNEADFRAKFKKVSALEEELAVSRAKVQSEIRKVLTAEQNAKLDALRKSRLEHFKEMQKRAGMGRHGGGVAEGIE